MPAAVPAGVRKLAHDDEHIIEKLFTATSRAENLHKLQIYTDSQMESDPDSRPAGKISLHASDMASQISFHEISETFGHK